jgi:putative ABC transport system permease protein
MFLALREVGRAKTRFGLLMAAIALLVFLILTQQALQTGLITAFIGAIQRQSAPVLVYSVDGERTLQGSIVTPDLEAGISRVHGVAESGRIGQNTFTVAVNDRHHSDAALIGYETRSLGAPDSLSAGRLPEAPGEAVGSAGDFAIGDHVRIVGGTPGPDLTVVGLARDAQINVTPTLFVSWPDYVAASRAANPDAAAILPNVIGVIPAPGVSPARLAARIDAALPQADALTRPQAAADTPGVTAIQSSFEVIFLLFALVVPLVTGLFFLIITLQKSRSLTLLRAIGAPAGALVRALLVEVVIILGCGIIIGTLLYAPVSQLRIGSLSLRFDAAAVLEWAALLLVLGVLSAFAAVQRVFRIDPVEATTGEGGR